MKPHQVQVSTTLNDGSAGYGSFRDANSGRGGHGHGDDGTSSEDEISWSFLSWYLGLLSKHPVLTKAVTSAVLTLIGDLICQLAIDNVSILDARRTFSFTLLGLVLVGLTLHFWYLYLSQFVTQIGALGASTRLILDQFLFTPIFIGVFLSILVTLEGRPSQVVPKLQQEWFSARRELATMDSISISKLPLCPTTFSGSYFLVGIIFQVLAANFVALIWNVILSFKAHKEIHHN